MTEPPLASSPLRRLALMALGWACVALGLVGIAVPGLPTTPFLLVAAWAFARSSRRFHAWLLGHRVLGGFVREWENHRVIPPRAKASALAGMGLGLTWMLVFADAPAYAQAAMAALCGYGAWFVLSRPSRRPMTEAEGE